jgi:nucleotide-binding universal stress UspA family protein
MYDTILVPTDGSDHAVRAAEHGLYLARAFDATVHLLNVVDVQAAAGLFDAGGVDRAFVERLEASGEEAIDAAEAVAGETDRVRTALVRGAPPEAIIEYAGEHGVDLIAMGTHGRTGLDRYVAGSVTERVVRRADVPVLTTRATERNPAETGYDEVLVPTDGSDHAAAATDHGLAIAERVGARVHALNVIELDRVAAARASVADLRDRLEAEGDRVTGAVATRAREAGLDAATAVREGSPAKVLLGYAAEHDVDLIAMGTAGRTGLDRYLVGSTTARTLRRADAAVLAINAGTRGRPAE